MASPAPAKTQPLHNFSLPQLKWSKNHSSNHQRVRRAADSSPPPPDSLIRNSPSSDTPARRPSPLLDSARRLDSAKRQSPMRDSASETESGYGSERRKKSATECARTSVYLSPPRDQMIEKPEKPPATSEADGSAPKETRSQKIYIRISKTPKAPEVPEKPKSTDVVPVKPKSPEVSEKIKSIDVVPEKPKSADVPEEAKKVSDEGKRGPEAMEFDEFEPKTWNLRPRKPLNKKSNGNGNAGTFKGGAPPQESRAQAQQATANRPDAQAAAEKKDKKPKLSVSLTRQEIEDDIFAMTGAKPNRRPKKRAKSVQKQLDNLYPGLYLHNVTPEMYKVPETTSKGKRSAK